MHMDRRFFSDSVALLGAAFVIATATSSCFIFEAVTDPWLDCPEEQQCLSGDIVSNEAKSCCAATEVCFVSRPMEGGSCLDAAEAHRRIEARKAAAPRQSTTP